MTRTRSLVACLAPAALILAGCRLSSLSVGYYDDHHHHRPHVTRVRTFEGHICTDACHDHFWNGNRIVVLSGHRHGPSCGHFWDGSHWVVRARRVTHVHHDPVRVTRVRHVHGPGCGHVFHPHRRSWITIKSGHVHGPGCGHVRIEGRWTIRD